MQFTLEQISQLIEKRTGLAVQAQLGNVLDDILITQAGGNLKAYLSHLKDEPETSSIWQNLLDALTIGETYFLRDRAQFQLIKTQLLPQLILRRRQQNQLELHLWSAGCASGEEAYSLAITLHELLPDIDTWKITLIGTDINDKALQTAQRGVYRQWAFRHTDVNFQQRYFIPTPNGLQIKPHIQNMVSFQQANLLHPCPRKFDLILCRNVMLYFNPIYAQQAEMILHDALLPEGWLIISQAETLHYNRAYWQMTIIDNIPIFQKRSPSPYQLTASIPQPKPEPPPLAIPPAIQTLYHNDPLAAEHALHQWLMQYPHHAQAHILLANLLANRQKILEAHQHLDLALELNPLSADGYYIRAMLHLEEGNPAEAKKSLREALYCQRDHALAAFMLGSLYAKENKIDLAIRQWRKAQQLITHFKPDDRVSDISDLRVNQLRSLIASNLK
ncbi:MAG: protein-glutamate O-methyltransferase CheR [Phototrophicales bacterium]